MHHTKTTSQPRPSSTNAGSDRAPASLIERALRRRRRGTAVWQWFDEKQRSHVAGPGLCRPLETEAGLALLEDRLGSRRTGRRRVVYVHVPFCAEICTFCAFFRRASMGDAVVEAYVNALCREVDRVADTPWARGRPFEAVYIGGGTPTTLAASQIDRLLAKLGALPLADDCEVTVEGRADGLDRAYLRGLVEAGVNRLSIGVQSFDTSVRRGVGRLADREGVLATLDRAGAAGFANLSVDLIYNLPGQTPATWAATLETLRRTPATGCSVYALLPRSRSVLGRQLARGEVRLGGIDAEYRCHAAAVDHFRRRPGWRRFSGVHYGRRDRETHRYNGVRSGEADVLGLGAGAAWRIDDLSGINLASVGRFIEQADAGRGAVAMAARTPEAVQAREPLFNLVHGPGVDADRFARLLPEWLDELGGLVELGLIHVEDGWCRLSDDGGFWAYNIASMLGEAIRQHTEAA